MSLTLQPDLESKLRERAEAEGLTLDAYLERLIWVDDATNEQLVQLALEGIDSGVTVVADDRFWEERRRELDRRLKMSTR